MSRPRVILWAVLLVAGVLVGAGADGAPPPHSSGLAPDVAAAPRGEPSPTTGVAVTASPSLVTPGPSPSLFVASPTPTPQPTPTPTSTAAPATPSPKPAGTASPTLRPTPKPSAPRALSACPMFPASNVWNRRIDGLPVASNSSTMVVAIGLNAHLHPDFGSYGGYGIPYN